MYVCECAYHFEHVENKGKLLEVYLSVHHSVLSRIKCRSSWLTADWDSLVVPEIFIYFYPCVCVYAYATSCLPGTCEHPWRPEDSWNWNYWWLGPRPYSLTSAILGLFSTVG